MTTIVHVVFAKDKWNTKNPDSFIYHIYSTEELAKKVIDNLMRESPARWETKIDKIEVCEKALESKE